MKPTSAQLTARYRKGLRAQVAGAKPPDPDSITRLALSISAAGVKTRELLDAHVSCMTEEILPGLPPGSRKTRSRGGSLFLASVLTAEGGLRGLRTTQDLCERMVDFAIKNTVLHEEVERGKGSESALRQKQTRLSSSLLRAKNHLEQIRAFSRQVLIAQEEERRKISQDLHDVIAQTLTAINIRLVALRKEASLNTKSLAGKIAVAQ